MSREQRPEKTKGRLESALLAKYYASAQVSFFPKRAATGGPRAARQWTAVAGAPPPHVSLSLLRDVVAIRGLPRRSRWERRLLTYERVAVGRPRRRKRAT